MALPGTQGCRRPRQPWLASATVCLSSLTVLLTPSCPVGNAFAFSTRAPLMRIQGRDRASTTSTGTATPRCASSNTASSAAPDFTEETFIEVNGRGYDDEKDGQGDGDTEDEFDDDDIHPSVAWLYPASSSDSKGGSSHGTNKPKRKPSRRTLCVDYGTRRVGLAIGVGISPRTVPGVTNRGSDLEIARQVLVRARGEGIRDIVVGLPLLRNGTETEMCEIVRSFASVLADVGAASRPTANVFLWDERFSSAQAGAMLNKHGGGMSGKVEIDSLAASIILEHFFEGGGADSAEEVPPSSGVVPAEVLLAAGRKETEEGQEKEEDAYGEGSRRRFQEMREESARSAAAGENASSNKKYRRRRRR